ACWTCAGREHDLADGEGGVVVGDHGAIGMDFDFRGLLIDVDGNAVACDVGLDCEMRKELDGEDPGFEGAVLLTDEDAALTGYGKGLEGLGMGADDGAGVIEGDGCEGREHGRELRGLTRLGGAKRGEQGNWGNEQTFI